jgi:uncharacterized protein
MVLRFVLTFGLAIWATGLAAQEATVLTVTGTGQISIAPDMATILVGVEVEAKTAKAALALNSSRMIEVFDTLTTSGIAKRDIQTSQFSLLPQWSSRNNSNTSPPKISGYAVTNVVSVRVRELDGLGPVLDGLTKSGANRIQAVQFTLADPDPYLDQARKLAVQDALRKAALFASAASLSTGQILSISEGVFAQPGGPQPQFRALSEATPIAEGETKLTASVTIRVLLD